MTSFAAEIYITISFILHICYSWTSMGSGSMAGVTYASGTIYNVGTMCPRNVNQGYVCDGRNFGNNYLDPGKTDSFCGGYTGTATQFGFGHGVTSDQRCGTCAQIRVPRTDGTYNYMTVMMVDHFTWSMEVGTTEIAYLVQGTRWVVGDRADFEFRIVGDYDCYASFDGDTGGTTPTTTTTTTDNGGGGSCGTRCGANWNDANSRCGLCCSDNGGCTQSGMSLCFADLSLSPCDGNNGGATNTPAPTTTTTTTSTTTSTTSSGGGNNGGGNSGGCGVNSRWGGMKISPWWGSTNSAMSAMISGNPTTITEFAIRGADQNNNQFQSCVKQNTNFFQCNIAGGLTEPASVKLNGGDYYGIDIIQSMTGSADMYPLAACSRVVTADGFNIEDDNKSGISWPIWFAICVIMLLGVAVICGICFYKKRCCFQSKKGYIGDKHDHDTIQLRDDDAVNTTVTNTTEMIDVENEPEIEDEAEIEIEIEVEAETHTYQ